MEFIRKNGFVLDYLESNLEQEVYEKERITSKVIMKVKQEIVKERVNDIYAMTVEGEGDSFCLESDEDDQGKKWMDIEITFTDIDNVEHTFLYYNEKYAKEVSGMSKCTAVIMFDRNTSDGKMNHAAINGVIYNSSSKKDIAYYAHTDPQNGKTSSLKGKWGTYPVIYYIIISFTWG